MQSNLESLGMTHDDRSMSTPQKYKLSLQIIQKQVNLWSFEFNLPICQSDTHSQTIFYENLQANALFQFELHAFRYEYIKF